MRRVREMLLWVLVVGCQPSMTGTQCLTNRDCMSPRVCAAGRCELERDLDVGSALDAAFDSDGGGDAGSMMDAQASGDAGSCECTPLSVESADCGVCQMRTRVCGGDCRWGSYSVCADANSRCPATAPTCRNDYCWGYALVGSGSTECIDLGADTLPADPLALGSYEIVIHGRPGASWVKQNRHLSCGGDWGNAESGILDAAGRDTEPPLVYGVSDCGNGTLGQFGSRVLIIDGPDTFTLPQEYVHNFFNSTCTADRNSCGTVFDYCSL